jgi:hypothetical protein
MSDNTRTTRACSFSQLQPELRQVIRTYFQEHQLGDPEAETRMCCETISKKKPAGKLAAWLEGETDTTIHTGMLLTSQRLIWARHGDKSGTKLTAANLKSISVREHASVMGQNPGLEITGYVEGRKSKIHGYIGMGPEEVAKKFRELVKDAINEVNPPAKNSWYRFLGG